MTTIDTSPTHPTTAEKEHAVTTKAGFLADMTMRECGYFIGMLSTAELAAILFFTLLIKN
jgi:hypothetical protein